VKYIIKFHVVNNCETTRVLTLFPWFSLHFASGKSPMKRKIVVQTAMAAYKSQCEWIGRWCPVSSDDLQFGLHSRGVWAALVSEVCWESWRPCCPGSAWLQTCRIGTAKHLRLLFPATLAFLWPTTVGRLMHRGTAVVGDALSAKPSCQATHFKHRRVVLRLSGGVFGGQEAKQAVHQLCVVARRAGGRAGRAAGAESVPVGYRKLAPLDQGASQQQAAAVRLKKQCLSSTLHCEARPDPHLQQDERVAAPAVLERQLPRSDHGLQPGKALVHLRKPSCPSSSVNRASSSTSLNFRFWMYCRQFFWMQTAAQRSRSYLVFCNQPLT